MNAVGDPGADGGRAPHAQNNNTNKINYTMNREGKKAPAEQNVFSE